MNLNKYFSFVIEKWFQGENKRPFITHAIEEISKKWHNKRIFLLEAPTGYGKSTISASLALYSIKEEFKALVVFPLRTLLEDQYEKFLKLFDKKILGKRYMHHPDSPYLIKPVTLTTIDTLSLVLFGIAPEDLHRVSKYYIGTSKGSLGHYLFSWASVALSNLVLDEVHLLSDTTKSLNFLVALLKIVESNDQRLILMSATIPEAFKKILTEHADGLEIISFDESFDRYFTYNRRSKKYEVYVEPLRTEEKLHRILEWIKREYKEFQRVLVIFNTVEDAINFYTLLKERRRMLNLIDTPILLLHSRFSEKDRAGKNEKLKEIKNKEEYIIIATQVIEAGIDISSNFFISELAPANSLIQRLGRFLRYENENKGIVYIWYEVDENGELLRSGKINKLYKVYNWDLANKTLKALEGRRINFHLPSSYSKLLKEVYSVDEFSIDQYCVDEFRGILMNFEYGSLVALEKFFELEGSFVRESYIAPIITEEFVEMHKKGNIIELESDTLSQLVIPASMKLLFKLKPKKEVILSEGKLIIQDVPPWLFSKGRKWEKIVRHIVRNNVQAFITSGEYSADKGLIIK